MAFDKVPLQNPNPAYRPVQWITKRVSANTIARCIATVTVNSNTYTLPAIPYDSLLSSGTSYYFRIDVQTLVQANMAPITSAISSIFTGFNIPYIALNTDMFAEVSISVTYLYIDPTTGKLTPLGVTDLSDKVYCLNSTPQHGEILSYAAYKPLFNDTEKFWLSQYPTRSKVSLTDNAWLTFISDAGANRIRVTTYDSAGVQIDTGLFAATLSSINKPQTVAVGVANLSAQVYLSGSVSFANPAVSYYTVQLTSSGFPNNPYLQVRRFDIVEPCNAVRLHWLGLLNGAESYTFTMKEKRAITVQNSFAQRTLTWDSTAPQNAIGNKGRFKIAAVGTEIREAISDYLSDADAIWLRSLLTSPEVYLETPEGLRAVVINTADQTTKTMDGMQKVQFAINFAMAVNIISQNN